MSLTARNSPLSPTTATSRATPPPARTTSTRRNSAGSRPPETRWSTRRGDNEWTDCHRPPHPTPEEADPLDRLDYLRGVFFPDDDSLGRKEIPLRRQGEDYPENARWQRGVTFAALHVVGSNNNRPTTLPDGSIVGNEEEYQARNAAILEWLAETFDEVKKDGSPAVMLVIHTNPFEQDAAEPSGFSDFKRALEEEVVAFGQPVVLVHGDSHQFRIDKPVISKRRPLDFTRVERPSATRTSTG